MAEERKVFSDSVIPLPVQPGTVHQGMTVNAAVPQGSEKMTVLFSLSIPQQAQAELEERVARGDIVSADEISKKYSPSAADVDSLTSWLQAQGFHLERISRDKTSVYAQGTVEQITKALAVKMVRVTKNGVTFTSAVDAPSLPADVGRGVYALSGLQPWRTAHKRARILTPKHGNRAALGGDHEDTEGRHDPSHQASHAAATNIDNAPPYVVQEVLKAYNADNLNVTGEGQTIAILIDTFPANSDLRAFWRQNGLSTTIDQVQKINVSGGHLPAPEGEETLDAEWTSGVAPGATIRIYASGSLEFVALDRALDRIIEDAPSIPGMRQLSISLGLGETFMGGAQGEVAVQHQKFLRLAAAGINIFVSSGDAGSNPDDTGQSSAGPLQAEYAASDPFVTGVGGTTLQLAANGAVASESGWAGSGGGKSIFFNRPSWQTGQGVPAGTERLVPDVSLAADPNDGAFVILHGQVAQIGGTSWSAPVWASFCALINEARSKAGLPPLPFLNPLIYPLAGTCFRDITQGTNGAFNVSLGYDLVTGIGVPNVKALIDALTATTVEQRQRQMAAV